MITHPNIKINIGLNVLRKRQDGYHDIETLFFPDYSYSDTLEIITGDEFSQTSAKLFSKYGDFVDLGEDSVDSVNLSKDSADSDRRPKPKFKGMNPFLDDEVHPTLKQAISEDGKLMITIAKEDGVSWNPLKDICTKAYFILDKDFNLPAVKIYLEKTSPVGAGLGGGSADGAFTLKMLNEIFKLNLSQEELANYAAQIGSDCAFFIYNRPMIGEGRGDILTPYNLNLDDYDIKLIFPGDLSISTAEAYNKIVMNPDNESIRTILELPVEEWKDRLFNSFETSVFESHPQLAAIKQSLYDSGATYASMSGSGSTIYGIYHK